MVAARLPAVAVHPLLDDHPLAVVGDDEAVQVEVEAVLHRGAVDLGDQAARLGQRGAVDADALADRKQFRRGARDCASRDRRRRGCRAHRTAARDRASAPRARSS